MGFTHNASQYWIRFEYLSGDIIGNSARPLVLQDVYDYAVTQSLSGIVKSDDIYTFTGWGLMIYGTNTYFNCVNQILRGISTVYQALIYAYGSAHILIDSSTINEYKSGKRFYLNSINAQVIRSNIVGFSYVQPYGCKITKSHLSQCAYIAVYDGTELSDLLITKNSAIWILGSGTVNNVNKVEGSNGIRLDAFNFQTSGIVEVENVNMKDYYQAALHLSIVNKFNSFALINCNVAPDDYYVGTISLNTGWMKIYFRTTMSIYLDISNYDLKIYDKDDNLILERNAISSFSENVDFDYIMEEFIDTVRQPTIRNTYQPFKIVISKVGYNDLEFADVSVILGEPTTLRGTMVLETPEITGVAVTNPGVTGDDGTIVVMAEKGTQPYEYSINGGEYQEEDTFMGLSEGTYSVSVRDANGNVDSVEGIALKADNIVTPRLTVLNVTQPGVTDDDGSIEVTAEGGVSPYEYSIDDGEYQEENIFSGLSAGDHKVNVMDSLGTIGELDGISLKATNPIVYYDRSIQLGGISKQIPSASFRAITKSLTLSKS